MKAWIWVASMIGTLCWMGSSMQSQGFQPSAPVFSWTQSGGEEKHCDKLAISSTGEVHTMTCNSGNTGRNARLATADLTRLQRWRETFGNVSFEFKRLPDRGGALVSLSMKGVGDAAPSEADRQEMLQWAESIYQSTVS